MHTGKFTSSAKFYISFLYFGKLKLSKYVVKDRFYVEEKSITLHFN